ncbi:MAG: hypothetical protein K8U03_26690 [Planctomycetia bacterium]|nr:hypothetical protein [Planctomycetia bacterium]
MKAVLIGCGLFVVLIAGAIGAMFWYGSDLIDKGMELVNEALAIEQERQTLAAGWAAPAPDATAQDVFPARLAGYERTAAEKSGGVPALKIDLAGTHALYEAGPSRIDAYVFPITKQAKSDLLQELEDLKKGAGSNTWSKVDLGDAYSRAYLSSDGLKQNHFWFLKDHLVLFRTTDSEDREPVVLAFFKANQKAPPAKEEGTASKETPDDKAAPAGKAEELAPAAK